MPRFRYEDIDWNALRTRAQKEKSWRAKGEADWDARASSFAKRTEQSSYVRQVIDRLNPEKNWSILDVGSGPGTLAIPLAARVQAITCIDFSAAMLAILRQRAGQMRLNNIETRKISWTDNWEAKGLKPHDVVIASRSLAVEDLKAALLKLTAFAIRRVVITDRVRHGPFDPNAFAALGRELHAGPDYIVTLNLLYQMGHLATVDFISIEDSMNYPSLEEAMARYTWMFGDLSIDETERLQHYVRSISSLHENGSVTLRAPCQPTWAFISWQPST